ncbi:hypothetical protein GQ55_1G406000 [Panicum hallii var. hallii]|uniref:Uncharacterized protein n=1 Tax=Panicum hallii var. hallii TaxID=1504633 RepID=A0A2T7FCP1_9POAL|nr:hypothetical protein GQ55_1G406000 [Panicum hallii var. hallii]
MGGRSPAPRLPPFDRVGVQPTPPQRRPTVGFKSQPTRHTAEAHADEGSRLGPEGRSLSRPKTRSARGHPFLAVADPKSAASIQPPRGRARCTAPARRRPVAPCTDRGTRSGRVPLPPARFHPSLSSRGFPAISSTFFPAVTTRPDEHRVQRRSLRRRLVRSSVVVVDDSVLLLLHRRWGLHEGTVETARRPARRRSSPRIGLRVTPSQQRYPSVRFRFGRDQSSSSSSAASGADRVSASGGAHCGGTNNSAHP